MATQTAVNGQAPPKKEIASATKDLELFGGLGVRGANGRIIASRDPVLIREAHGRLPVYRDTERDTEVFANLQKRYDMTVNAPMMVKPGKRRGMSVRKMDMRAADMVREQLENMGAVIPGVMRSLMAHAKFNTDFDAALYGMLDAVLMGYSVGEVMWGTDGRETVATEIRIREQDRFRFNDKFELRLLTHRGGLSGIIDGEPLPARKFLAYTFGSFWDPYGLGLAHRLYWPVRFKRKDLTYWLKFLDKYGGPTTVGKYPDGANDEQQEKLLAAAAAVQSDSAVVIPDDMILELLEGIKTAAQAGYDQIAKYLDGQIAKAILGVALSNVTSIGSGTSRDMIHTEQREKGRRDSIFLLNFLRCTLVQWIMDFNFPPGTPTPQLIKLFPDLEALKEWSQIDNTLGQIGFRRRLEFVNRLYGHGEDVYEAKPIEPPVGAEPPKEEVAPTPEDTGAEGAEEKQANALARVQGKRKSLIVGGVYGRL